MWDYMQNRHHYIVVVIFITLSLFLTPGKAFAGSGGIGAFGVGMAMLAGMILLVFLITTGVAVGLLKLRESNLGWQRAVVNITLLVYSIFYIPLIMKLFLKESFSYQYSYIDRAGLSKYIISLSFVPVIGLFLLKQFLAKRYAAVIWLSSGFILVPVALLYIIIAVSSGYFMKNLSSSGLESFVTIPLILAAIMLVGAIINARISTNIEKVNMLFISLFFIAAVIMRSDDYAYAFWAIVGIIVAWILQRKSTKRWQRNESHNQNAREGR